MGIECKIHLEKRSEEDFIPGDAVRGQVNYILDNDITLTGILLALKGKARCYWTEQRGNTQATFVGKERLFTHIVELLDQKSTGSDGKIVVAAGSYTHDFQFVLPEQIPYTFEKSSNTYVTYTLKLTFAKPELFKKNAVFRKVLKVAPYVDLSSYAYATTREPSSYTVTREQTVMFSKVGEMTTRVNLPRTAYTPGEAIPITFDVQNNTTLTLPCIRAKIVKIRRYTSNGNNRAQKYYPVCKSQPTEEIQAGVQGRFSCELQVPHETAPSLLYSRVLAVEYVIRLRVCYPGMRFDAKMDIPIKIGSLVHACSRVPRGAEATTSAYDPAAASAASAAAPAAYSAPAPPPYQPPPSYWEVMQLDQKADD